MSKQLVYGSTHAVIGKYNELNPNNCGISRFSPKELAKDHRIFLDSNKILFMRKGINKKVNNATKMN